MADPFTMMAVAATALTAGSAIMGGNAEYSQEMGNSQVSQENARRARENAAQTRLAGSAAEEAKRRELRKSLGRTAAAASQSGTGGPGYGSNLAVIKQASTEAELDALNLRYSYNEDARGSEAEALNFDAEATAARRRARGARKAGFINAASAVLQGAANYGGGRASSRVTKARKTPTPSGGKPRPSVRYGTGPDGPG